MLKNILFIVITFLGFQQLLADEPISKVCFQFYAYKNIPNISNYNKECMPCTPSELDAGTIAFTKYWKVVYVPNQSYLGRVVITSQRHFGSYEEMNDEEAYQYRQIFKQLLPAIQKTFNVTHFNVAYLMNMAFNSEKPEPAFKDGKPNPHFHWHVIPRYDGKREFGGEVFEDPDFGNSFNLKRKKTLEGEFRKKAIEAIRTNLNIIYLTN